MSQKKTKRPAFASEDDEYVAVFAASVARAIGKYEVIAKNYDAGVARQKIQVELLNALEEQSRQALIQDPRGLEVYEKFVIFIRDERRNALAAQPFFREPEKTFIDEIGPALKSGFVRHLFKFHFNYNFVAHARRAVVWSKDDPFWVLTEKLLAARTELIEMNMPLAISRARMFYNRTPKSQLEYLDLIQCAVEGLIAAIDKYRLPYRPVFRSVAIGRMTGIFIDRYSDTMVRFFPLDRRRIYRANKALRRTTLDQVDMQNLTEIVNDGMDPHFHASTEDLACLMSAVSCLSMDWQDSTADGDEGASFGDALAAPESHRPDVMFAQAEEKSLLYGALRSLPMISQKAVRMKMGLESNGLYPSRDLR
jgi:DNA-directed RNA polymerase specialized sigma subunit